MQYPSAADLPHYCCPLLMLRDRARPTLGLEVHATGTLLTHRGARLVVTADHVFDGVESKHVLYPETDDKATGFSRAPITVDSSAKISGPPVSNLDIAVLDLGSQQLHSRYRFLDSGLLGRDEPVDNDVKCIVSGYRLSSNKTRKNSPIVDLRQEYLEFATLDPQEYEKYGLHPALHLAVYHDKRVTSQKGKKIKPPPMRGLSGGGMWIDTGSGFALAAITSEHLSDHRIVYGTRIAIALQLLDNP